MGVTVLGVCGCGCDCVCVGVGVIVWVRRAQGSGVYLCGVVGG